MNVHHLYYMLNIKYVHSQIHMWVLIPAGTGYILMNKADTRRDWIWYITIWYMNIIFIYYKIYNADNVDNAIKKDVAKRTSLDYWARKSSLSDSSTVLKDKLSHPKKDLVKNIPGRISNIGSLLNGNDPGMF